MSQFAWRFIPVYRVRMIIFEGVFCYNSLPLSSKRSKYSRIVTVVFVAGSTGDKRLSSEEYHTRSHVLSGGRLVLIRKTEAMIWSVHLLWDHLDRDTVKRNKQDVFYGIFELISNKLTVSQQTSHWHLRCSIFRLTSLKQSQNLEMLSTVISQEEHSYQLRASYPSE